MSYMCIYIRLLGQMFALLSCLMFVFYGKTFFLHLYMTNVYQIVYYDVWVLTGDPIGGAVGCQTFCVCSRWTRNWKESGKPNYVNETTYRVEFAPLFLEDT